MRKSRVGERYVVISGCSGGGKSTLLAELERRGFDTVKEPGREIVKEQLEIGGDALPWANATKFVASCIARGIAAYMAASEDGRIVLFDRSVIDAVSAYQKMNGKLPEDMQKIVREYRYSEHVYMVPPWAELFANDAERRHGFDEALNEYDRLVHDYVAWGYKVEVIPKLSLPERASYLESRLRETAL